MEASVSRYYGENFQGYWDSTQVGGGTFPPNLKYFGGCGCLTLIWSSVIEIAALKKVVVAKHKCKRPKKIFRLD